VTAGLDRSPAGVPRPAPALPSASLPRAPVGARRHRVRHPAGPPPPLCPRPAGPASGLGNGPAALAGVRSAPDAHPDPAHPDAAPPDPALRPAGRRAQAAARPGQRPEARGPTPRRHLGNVFTMFDSLAGHGCSPQIGPLSFVHTLGRGKLSRRRPQGTLSKIHRGSSAGCGFVDNRSPQAVDDPAVHSGHQPLSTGDPQVSGGCPQLFPASPQSCPLFGNMTPALTGSSERRHMAMPA
jgi:hypothetical protein